MVLDEPTWRVMEGDARRLDLPDESVHTVVLSPPYWNLRRYLDDEREIGREDTLQEWVDNLVECAREWRRVLRDNGTLWVNVGDAFASGNRTYYDSDDKLSARGIDGRPVTPRGLKPKDLIGLPWRLAFALQADGWYLRSAICWAKGIDWLPNERAAQDTIYKALQKVREEATVSLFGLSKGLDAALKKAERAVDRIMTSGPCMPESCKDRCTSSYEMLFMFSKQPRYYFDQTAIRVGFADERMGNPGAYKWSYANDPDTGKGVRGSGGSSSKMQTEGWNSNGSKSGRNPRSVWLLWRVNTEPAGTYILPDGEEVAHFAQFPSRLVRRILKCSTSQAGVCATCGSPWKRVERQGGITSSGGQFYKAGDARHPSGDGGNVSKAGGETETMIAREHLTVAWHPTCLCHGSPTPGPIPCEHCRGTGHQRVGMDYEGKWEDGDKQSASRRLLAHTRAAREAGADHEVGAGDPTATYTGDPCPHCSCPDCGGTGQDAAYPRGSEPYRLDRVPNHDLKRDHDGKDFAGKVPTGNPCPTCHGLGSLGYLSGPVWEDEVLESWPRVPATVLDPMAGSGTTGRAALDLGLSVVLNDLNPQYCRLMRARMESYPDDVPIKRRNGSVEEENDPLPLFEEMGVEV